MCGFVGRASKLDFAKEKTWIKDGNLQIKHRGPDGFGFWNSSDRKVELAHRRLAVIDVSEAASQPMSNKELGMTIAFNGEIYNHNEIREKLIKLGYKFTSKSDTEVLLAAYKEWGLESLDKLNGMFAFVIYDFHKKELFFARDRAGEKPFYYYYDGESISFASELKGLLCNNKIERFINTESLDCYLSFGFIPGSRCIFSNIRKLVPGGWLKFSTSSGRLSSGKYWNLPKENFKKGNLNNLLQEFDCLFKESVTRQLEADVPVGVLLSGGLDSSLVTATASKMKDGIKTFNVRFPGFGSLDETEHARKIAKFFGTEHIELDASTPDPSLLLKLSKQFDEPIIDSSMIPTFLVCEEVKKYCTVALGGDGADELFGGYSHYEKILRINSFLKYIPQKIQEKFSDIVLNAFPEDFKGSNWVNSLKFNYSNESPLVASYFNYGKRKKLLNQKDVSSTGFAEKLHIKIPAYANDLIGRATRSDFLTYLPEDILVKVDRASMINSLEVRAPFLDFKIINFAFSKVPSSYKVNGKNKKILLQKYAKEILPESFSFGRKQGFSIPLNSWMKKGPFKEFIYEVLLERESIFNKKEVLKTLRANENGKNNSEKIFGLVMFELWKKNYGAEL